MNTAIIPDALHNAICKVIADQREEWAKERGRIEAESRAILAETKAAFTQIVSDLVAENHSLRSSLHDAEERFKERMDQELKSFREIVEQLKDGEPGPPGPAGQDANEDAIVERLRSFIPQPIPGPKGDAGIPGVPGNPGKDAEVDYQLLLSGLLPFTKTEIEEQLARQIAALPVPERGEKGDPGPIGLSGERGDPGEPGKDADPFVLLPEIERMVSEAVSKVEPIPGPPGPQGEQGEPGKGIDPEEVVSLVLDRLPAPEKGVPGKDGRDGRSIATIKRLGDQIVIAMTDGELLSFDDIRGPIGPVGPQGNEGKPGQSVDPAEVKELVDEEVTRAVAAISIPNGDPLVLLPEVEKMVVEAVAKIEPVPGPIGPQGNPGTPGKDAEVDYDRLQDAVEATARHEVEKQLVEQIAQLPPPEPGPRGPRGEPGLPGRDGADISGGFVSRDGRAILTLSDGRLLDFGVVVGKDGRDGVDGKDGSPGKDGKDGFGFEDLEVVQEDGGRKAVLRFVRGDQVKEFPVYLPGQLYRGVYKPEVQYEAGDTVSFGGSMFVATKSTSNKPEEASEDWKLCVKRGRDGRDGKPGEKGEKGSPGTPGRDLTNLK